MQQKVIYKLVLWQFHRSSPDVVCHTYRKRFLLDTKQLTSKFFWSLKSNVWVVCPNGTYNKISHLQISPSYETEHAWDFGISNELYSYRPYPSLLLTSWERGSKNDIGVTDDNLKACDQPRTRNPFFTTLFWPPKEPIRMFLFIIDYTLCID